MTKKNKKPGYFYLDKNYRYTLNALPRGRLEPKVIPYSCNVPYMAITIDDNLNCLLCVCDGWLPVPVGKVTDFDCIEDVFNSGLARIIQSDVDDKKYTWCAVHHCGVKNHDINLTSYKISINIDRSCNLQCPSCRREKYIVTSGSIYESKIQAAKKILKWLQKFKEPINIITSGDGDPLASFIMRPIIKNWQNKPNQTLTLKTNGLLLRKQLTDNNIIQNISSFDISVDAGSKQVYEKVRLGGKWKSLLDNFEFLVEQKLESKTSLQFVLQNNNFYDLQNFADLCDYYGFKGHITQLDDWGTWNHTQVLNPDLWTQQQGYFFDHDVLDSQHKNYVQCKHNVSNLIDCENITFQPIVLQRLGL